MWKSGRALLLLLLTGLIASGCAGVERRLAAFIDAAETNDLNLFRSHFVSGSRCGFEITGYTCSEQMVRVQEFAKTYEIEEKGWCSGIDSIATGIGYVIGRGDAESGWGLSLAPFYTREFGTSLANFGQTDQPLNIKLLSLEIRSGLKLEQIKSILNRRCN